MPGAEGVRAELEVLRHKLLDLTLRNRMLNYRPSVRLGIVFFGESTLAIHSLLVEQGKKMSFVGKPDPPVRLKNATSLFTHEDEVSMAAHRQAAQEELAAFLENAAVPVDQMDTKLSVDEFESALQIKLRAIQREANLANDELGINTLFLTLGTLEWRETAERSFRAPLLYVPVRLERQLNGTMRLVHDGSDVGENLPLQAKLLEFNLKLPELSDEKALFEYFDEVEASIRSRDDWTIHRDEICLGFFNYEKYAMYVDLSGEHWPEGRKPWLHEDLFAMLSGQYPASESPLDGNSFLDASRPVADCHEVYDADSSQVLAMIRAAEGLSIVVEGPPGTGKSQTITNIIAEAVAADKKVLFVSAKRAALDVVKRRLVEADLGDMCLDLHDKLTNRREFYAEIKRTASKSLTLRSEEERVVRLTELREKLNAHAFAVNAPVAGFNVSPFAAMARLGGLPKEAAEDREGRIPFEVVRGFSEATIRSFLPAVKALQARLTVTGVPVQHPFWGTELRSIDPALKLDIEEDLRAAIAALQAAIEAISEGAQALRIDPPAKIGDLPILRACLDRALSAPALDGIAVKTDTWIAEERTIREAIGLIERHQELGRAYRGTVTEAAWSQDLSGLLPAYEKSADKWYGFLAGDLRRARKTLAPYLTQRLDPLQEHDLVQALVERREIEAKLQRATELPRLYGVQWQGPDSDPAVLEKLLQWVVDLHRTIGAQQLPPGLLDLFSGQVSGEELRAKVEEATTKVLAALDAYRKVLKDLEMPLLSPEETVAGILDRAELYQASLSRLNEFIVLNEARRALIDKNLAPLVEMADRWPKASQSLTDSFLRSYYTGVVREAMQQRPELRTFDRHEHEASIAEFQSLDDFKLRYNRAKVRMAHMRGIPSFGAAVPGSNLHLLNIQCELKTRHKPIRWIMARAGEAIQRIKPVFMMSPLSVAIHLPPEMPQFDLVIFDEASQVRPEDALCAVVRAHQTIVVGDTRQMPPTSFFDRVADDELEDDSEEITEVARETAKLESILSLMSAAAVGSVRRPDLRWHYRSVHPGLIQPSNEMFYGNRLIIFPSTGDVSGGRRIGVLFHHDATTVYEQGARKRINQKEADQVAEAVLRHVRENPEQSLMVAAMNKPQADLIYEKVLVLERENAPVFANFRAQHPHEPLDVKNLENVQGDERDVVFISITYGRDANGAIRQQFGPLLRDGGERRLNVLITRARKRCEVFSNLRSDDIRADSQRPGLSALKNYLKFAETGHLEASSSSDEPEESPFEQEIARVLTDRGYEVVTHVGCADFRIDLAVRSSGRYVLGIECDGASYSSARSARDRDKLRERVLEDRGWRIHRIWAHDWWQDRESEIDRLLDAINATTDEVQDEVASDETAELVQETARADVESGVRPYTVAEDPPAVADRHTLSEYLVRVVEAEGPIHHELLILRIRDAAGFDRVGRQLRETYEGLIGAAVVRGAIFESGDGYYAADEQLAKPKDWSDRPASERKIGYLSATELRAALVGVIGANFGMGDEAATKGAYGLLGFRRVGEDAQAKARQELANLRDAGTVVSKGGLLYLTAKQAPR